jgi:hypothetical protein
VGRQALSSSGGRCDLTATRDQQPTTHNSQPTNKKRKASAVAWKLFWCFVAFSWSQGPKRFEFLERLKTKCRRPDPRAGIRRSYFFLVVFFAVDFFVDFLAAFFAMALLPPFSV